MIPEEQKQAVREKVAFEIKGVMPTIILDYVNNNEIIKLQDCLMLTDQILALIKEAGYVSPEEVAEKAASRFKIFDDSSTILSYDVAQSREKTICLKNKSYEDGRK